jgi:uncharacterized membrane protein YeaQ/YmgE (transglycosylase-associated protein family)
MNIILWIIFGALAGWIASMIMNTNKEQGAVANIIIGIVGAFIGGFLSQLLGGPGVSGFSLTSLFIAVLGSVVLIFFIRMLSRGSDSTMNR